MAKITRNRGTGSAETDDTDSTWAGKKFKDYQDSKNKKGTITSGRGTSSKKLEDIPKTDLPDTEGVSKSSARGTKRGDSS